MQIVSLGDNLHEVPDPSYFLGKIKKNISKCHLLIFFFFYSACIVKKVDFEIPKKDHNLGTQLPQGTK